MAELSAYRRFLDVPLTVEATAAGPPLSLDELLDLEIGSVVVTGLRAGETISVYAADLYLGEAQLDEVDGRCAVRMLRFEGKS